jgi:hypothetical protein
MPPHSGVMVRADFRLLLRRGRKLRRIRKKAILDLKACGTGEKAASRPLETIDL